MPSSQKTPSDIIKIISGDITALACDAIVNAANQALLPGGGVCGAIHAAAGPQLAEACQPLAPCPVGEARITPGFDLKARHVIHTVGPVWQGGDRGEAELLGACYRNAVACAMAHGVRSLAFPAISTGIFGYPEQHAADIAVSTLWQLAEQTPEMPQIYLCCFTPSSRRYLETALNNRSRESH